ncbi:acylneuraminate cytidylyltransferase family protein [uncultured Dokdonia sp.]|uniref:acylneuraminate cytidylyltransferase family protein n=1 Tax=uncultured Dokdonia sp. TaxID=575653 RepID=UPI00262CA485|nr:acylneuraminate cytidylyltransferase family protein [uncultured Dokdonia sp.]
MKVLGLIPARGGSKGIPGKNKKLLGGHPLLHYTIEAGLKATKLDTLIFSSEDEELMTLARDLGVSVPFQRPQQLAEDHSGSLGVVQHALQFMQSQGKQYDAVCLLQVTNPFRSAQLIDKAVSAFAKANTDSLVSVLKVPHEYNPHWVFEATKDGKLQIATGEKEIIKRRQDLPDAYIRDGAIYMTKSEVLLEQNSLYGSSISYIESDPVWHVNIDTMDDWKKAEELVKKWKD